MSDPAAVKATPPATDWLGVHYAVRIFIATSLLWMLLKLATEASPIWAISSMIATSDPMVKHALDTFWGRIINTLVGCVLGLGFLLIGGTYEITLPIALAITVLVSSYLIRMPVMWRQAPISAAIIIAAGLEHHSKITGIEFGLKRVAEVMLGCVVGIFVTWAMSKIWPPPQPAVEKKVPAEALSEKEPADQNPPLARS